MPRYKCTKEVHALKIREIGTNDNGDGILIPEEEEYCGINVTKEFMNKHNPHTGGYYVVYQDGYESFSPQKAFEEGYFLIKSFKS